MMGYTHALSGGVLFLALLKPLSGVMPVTPATAALGTAVAAGAALLPDLDHPHATAARTFGPITKILSKAVTVVSGGHRRATHSLLGITAITAIAAAATIAGGWPMAVLLALCIGLADRALLPRAKPRKDGKLQWGDVAGIVHAAAAVGVAYLIVFHGGLDLSIVPVAVAIGAAAHVLGDALTESGVPWLWPHDRRYRVATIDTGKGVEKWVVVPALYVALAATFYFNHDIWMPTLYTLTKG